MNALIPPIEAVVRVEVNTLLTALSHGDFATAAESQARLKELGWYFGREVPKRQRNRPTPRQTASHMGGAQ
jgi:hypothetical protein